MFKKLLLSIFFVLSIFSITSCKKGNNEINKKMDEYIDTMISNTKTYTPSWNQENFKGKWNYIDGVFLKSIIDKYNETKEEKYIKFVVKFVNYYIDKDGNFKNIRNIGLPGYTSGELDSVCESRILFDLLDYTNDSRYEVAIQKTYDELMIMPFCVGTNNYWHKQSYVDQVWLDGMYMYAPFMTRYALKYNDSSLLDLLLNQYQFIRDNMFNEEKELYYHAMDVSRKIFWADKETGLSKSFWLRGEGWLIASLADVLDYLKDKKYKKYYEPLNNIFEEAIEGIIKYIDPEYDMLYQVIDRKGEGALVSYNDYLYYLNDDYNETTYIENYLESAGSSLISYSMLKHYPKDSDKYKIGLDIFEGIYNHSFKDNSLNDICITAGLGPDNRPYRDSTFEYYLAEKVGSNDAKGVGPFIMAYLNR